MQYLAWWLGVVLVDVGDVLGQPKIVFPVGPVGDQPQKVETRQQRSRKLNVLSDRLLVVIAAVCRIGGGKNGDASVQGGHDSGLGNGHSLLFHNLVDGSSILVEILKICYKIMEEDCDSNLNKH
jgi:hypothetical protein